MTTNNYKNNNDKKLSLFLLIAMCVGSMIGSGLFDLPQNVVRHTGIIGMLIAWLITFVGMISLATVFQNLSMRRPDLDVGVYAYAREGLGNYLGFNSAWGYWISVWIGNAGYIIMLCAALSVFSSLFGDGTSLASLIVSSLIIWIVTFLCICGRRSAALVNSIITVVKVVPIIIFILLIAFSFNLQTFADNFLQAHQVGTITNQIKGMMLVTVWVFIGIESANVFSARAQNRRDIGKATIASFLIMFFILFAISFLPFGVLPQKELAILTHPSTGALLARIIGPYGQAFMNVALVISVLGAFLSWVLIAAEVPYVASKHDGLFPKIFALENKVNFPVGSLLITAILEQSYLIFAHFYHAGYLATITLAVTMVLPPYLFSAFYAVLLAVAEKTYGRANAKERTRDLVVSVVAVVYGVWLLYAAGHYLLMSSVLYFIGSLVFIANRIWRKQKVFNKYELVVFLLIGVASALSVVFLMTGKIVL